MDSLHQSHSQIDKQMVTIRSGAKSIYRPKRAMLRPALAGADCSAHIAISGLRLARCGKQIRPAHGQGDVCGPVPHPMDRAAKWRTEITHVFNNIESAQGHASAPFTNR